MDDEAARPAQTSKIARVIRHLVTLRVLSGRPCVVVVQHGGRAWHTRTIGSSARCIKAASSLRRASRVLSKRVRVSRVSCQAHLPRDMNWLRLGCDREHGTAVEGKGGAVCGECARLS